jgi:hypothetical protein
LLRSVRQRRRRRRNRFEVEIQQSLRVSLLLPGGASVGLR